MSGPEQGKCESCRRWSPTRSECMELNERKGSKTPACTMYSPTEDAEPREEVTPRVVTLELRLSDEGHALLYVDGKAEALVTASEIRGTSLRAAVENELDAIAESIARALVRDGEE